VRYLKEKIQESQRSHEKKNIQLTDSSGRDSSSEGEVIAQLKDTFHTVGKRHGKVQI
jgi:hypothetical protein